MRRAPHPTIENAPMFNVSIGRIEPGGPDPDFALTPHRDITALFILTADGAPALVSESSRVRAAYVIRDRSPNPGMIGVLYGMDPGEHCRYAEIGEVLYAPSFDGLDPVRTVPLRDYDDYKIMSMNFISTLHPYAAEEVFCAGGY